VVVVAAVGAGVWLVAHRPAERPKVPRATPRDGGAHPARRRGRARRERVPRPQVPRHDARRDVAHKHGIGSCRGQLLATTAGLRYEADKPAESFAVGYDELQPLEVDYLSRNLRVKQRGGRTWNFTADRADPLLGFQQAVEKARKRLSAPSS